MKNPLSTWLCHTENPPTHSVERAHARSHKIPRPQVYKICRSHRKTAFRCRKEEYPYSMARHGIVKCSHLHFSLTTDISMKVVLKHTIKSRSQKKRSFPYRTAMGSGRRPEGLINTRRCIRNTHDYASVTGTAGRQHIYAKRGRYGTNLLMIIIKYTHK